MRQIFVNGIKKIQNRQKNGRQEVNTKQGGKEKNIKEKRRMGKKNLTGK